MQVLVCKFWGGPFLCSWSSAPLALSPLHLSISPQLAQPKPGPLQHPMRTGCSIPSKTSFPDDRPILRGSEPVIAHLVLPLGADQLRIIPGPSHALLNHYGKMLILMPCL